MKSQEHGSLRLAATAIPVRESNGRVEVLMVQRNHDLSFGGMWVFPGGKFEQGDGPAPSLVDETAVDWGSPRILATAANAAVRETSEETAMSCSTASLAWFSHWIPPATVAKRFATWFFLAPETTGVLDVDERESMQARWISPQDALDEYASNDFPMAVPTWCTLDDMRQHTSIGLLIDHAITQGPRIYHTRAVPTERGRMLVWQGDAAYETGDLDGVGGRNRILVDRDFNVVERLT